MSDEKRKKIFRDRMFFFGILGAVLLVVMLFNRKALLDHPSRAEALETVPRASTVPMDTPVTNVTFVIFDTETTGVDPGIDRLVELAAIKFRDGKMLEEKSWLINPERFIPAGSTEIHGISSEMVQEAKIYPEVHEEFMEFIDRSVLIAHNARFDVQFMNVEFERSGEEKPPNVTLDSLRLFRRWFPDLESYSLSYIAEYLDVTLEGAFHRAGADSQYVGFVLDKSVKERNPAMTLGELVEDANGALTF